MIALSASSHDVDKAYRYVTIAHWILNWRNTVGCTDILGRGRKRQVTFVRMTWHGQVETCNRRKCIATHEKSMTKPISAAEKRWGNWNAGIGTKQRELQESLREEKEETNGIQFCRGVKKKDKRKKKKLLDDQHYIYIYIYNESPNFLYKRKYTNCCFIKEILFAYM